MDNIVEYPSNMRVDGDIHQQAPPRTAPVQERKKRGMTPSMQRALEQADPNTPPIATIVILDTPGAGGQREYRIGTLTKEDFQDGLRCKSEYRDMSEHLNKKIAKKCFEKSSVYIDLEVAEAAAKEQYGHLEAGIKIMQFHEPWPGVPCHVVE